LARWPASPTLHIMSIPSAHLEPAQAGYWNSPVLLRRLVLLSCALLEHRYYYRERRGKVDLICRRCGRIPLSQ